MIHFQKKGRKELPKMFEKMKKKISSTKKHYFRTQIWPRIDSLDSYKLLPTVPKGLQKHETTTSQIGHKELTKFPHERCGRKKNFFGGYPAAHTPTCPSAQPPTRRCHSPFWTLILQSTPRTLILLDPNTPEYLGD